MHEYSGTVADGDTNKGRCITSTPYCINSCGHFKIHDRDISLKRTRVDYYIIYIINGMGHYMTDTGIRTAKAGNLVIYKPHQPQDYYYKASDKATAYWLHFTGGQAGSLINELELGEDFFHPVGIHSECIELFDKIIHELQIRKPYYHQMCISYLLQLLSSFSRNIRLPQIEGHKTRLKEDLENVILAMHQEYQQGHLIDYYAEKSSLSLFQFIRNFKELTGYSPGRYIEKLRIEKARELLLDSSLSITEISEITGYKDPFYFSKVFKKTSGVSPSAFRSTSDR